MPELKDLQKNFIDFLRGQDSQMESLIVNQKPVPIHTRLGIYQNAYRERLKDVLAVDHELLATYLGHELFDQMAYGYIAEYPSTFTSLRQFADRLPKYLSEVEPFSELPILAEFAGFERSLLQVFDAGEVERKVFADLLALEPELWPEMRLRFHPSTQIKNFSWNSIAIWKALKAEKEPPERIQEDSVWLLWRDTDRLSSFIPIQNSESFALRGFLQGENFANICEILSEWHDEEAVGEVAVQYLKKWFDMGMIREIVLD